MRLLHPREGGNFNRIYNGGGGRKDAKIGLDEEWELVCMDG